jgi:hypothetical protein
MRDLPRLILASGFLLSITSGAAAQTCSNLATHAGNQVLRNDCNYEITLVYCGVGPTGNSTLDCNRNQLAMRGLRPGSTAVVGDRNGGYARVYWFECPGGRTPSRQRWNGSAIQGECPR